MRVLHATTVGLLALGCGSCDGRELDQPVRTTENSAPRGRPIRAQASASAPDTLVSKDANALETVAPPLDPIADLAERGFEALRMTEDERTALERSIVEHDKLELPRSAFPERIQVLHDAPVRIRGWMIPGALVKGRARDFMLVRDNQACCFGSMPTFDEWIHVEMVGDKSAEYVRYGAIEVSGQLEVGGPAVAEGVKPPALRMRADSCELIRRR